MEVYPLNPEPSSIGACSRCRTRKVKCDGRVPKCAACTKHKTTCDIKDHVFYSYEDVQKLQATIDRLEHELRQSPNAGIPSSLGSHHSPVNQRIETTSAHVSLAVSGSNATTSESQVSHRAHCLGDQMLTIESLAEEVGSLALGQQSSQQYVGSAAGSSFCRIFFHQLNLVSEDIIGHLGSNLQHADLFVTQASLPPKPVGNFLLSTYIVRIHAWRPVFNLKDLRSWFQQAYSSPRSLDAFQRFSILLVLALGSHEAEEMEADKSLRDIQRPSEYFTTGMKFFEEISSLNNLQSLQSTLLLAFWLTKVSCSANNTFLWQISRFAMSLAIELGCHRNNPRWEISSSERELRNRNWWCTYDLERNVAVSTGRVLSIRNQAIDAPFPKVTDDDQLTASERKASPTFATKGFSPAIHMFRLRNITGDILESIYIARPGHHSSIQDTNVVADTISERLARWHSILGECAVPESRESLEMRVELCLAVVLLNRPSPSFPNPMPPAVEACDDACRTAIEIWKVLLAQNELGISWSSFHDVFLTGLVWFYCACNLSTIDPNSVEIVGASYINILEHIDRKTRMAGKYVRFFRQIQTITIRRLQSQLPASMQGANIDAEIIDPLGFDWMDGCFNEMFTGGGNNFPLDFSMNEEILQIPDHSQEFNTT